MVTETGINEKFLQRIWEQQNFMAELFTLDGQEVKILEAGVINEDKAGPDFINAKIKIGNITFTGDVEIDRYHTDWNAHGHHLNKRFNSVILHGILVNDSEHHSVISQNGRKIPCICFADYLEEGFVEELKKVIGKNPHKRNMMPCIDLNENLTREEKINVIFDYGIKRFKKKTERMLFRLKELIYLSSLKVTEPKIGYELPKDIHEKELELNELNNREVWEQLFYENLFEALGYSQNKVIFQKLAEAANIEFIKSLPKSKQTVDSYEAVLFAVSGLMPDVYNLKSSDTSSYTRMIYDIWNEVSHSYDGEKFSEEQWHFFKLRPQNFPTVRIAGGARLLYKILHENLIRSIIHSIAEIKFHKGIISALRRKLIIPSEGYWSEHYVFDKPSKEKIRFFVGANRADEIILNIVLPYTYLYFELFNKKEFSSKIIKLYSDMTIIAENNIVREISTVLNLDNIWQKTVYYQGLLELFRTYCTKKRCMDCEIGTKVFN